MDFELYTPEDVFSAASCLKDAKKSQDPPKAPRTLNPKGRLVKACREGGERVGLDPSSGGRIAPKLG